MGQPQVSIKPCYFRLKTAEANTAGQNWAGGVSPGEPLQAPDFPDLSVSLVAYSHYLYDYKDDSKAIT